jgi:ABC-type antimicrobial peptide transport system permease subunit
MHLGNRSARGTREIGVRLAVGTSRREILIQSLAEAMMVSLSGGLIGILLAASSLPASYNARSSRPGVS